MPRFQDVFSALLCLNRAEQHDEEWHAEVCNESVEHRYGDEFVTTGFRYDGKRCIHGGGSSGRYWC